MASMAYSTWKRRPSGENVLTPLSYSLLHTHTHTHNHPMFPLMIDISCSRGLVKLPKSTSPKTNAVTRKSDKREGKKKKRRRSISLQMNTLLKTWWAAPRCTPDVSNLFARNARRLCRISGRNWGETENALQNTFLSSALMSPSQSPRSTSQMRWQECRSGPIQFGAATGQCRAGQGSLDYLSVMVHCNVCVIGWNHHFLIFIRNILIRYECFWVVGLMVHFVYVWWMNSSLSIHP